MNNAAPPPAANAPPAEPDNPLPEITIATQRRDIGFGFSHGADGFTKVENSEVQVGRKYRKSSKVISVRTPAKVQAPAMTEAKFKRCNGKKTDGKLDKKTFTPTKEGKASTDTFVLHTDDEVAAYNGGYYARCEVLAQIMAESAAEHGEAAVIAHRLARAAENAANRAANAAAAAAAAAANNDA